MRFNQNFLCRFIVMNLFLAFVLDPLYADVVTEDSFDKRKIFAYDTGIPLVLIESCSGAVVQSDQSWEGQQFFVTASHCRLISNLLFNKTAYNSFGFMGLHPTSHSYVRFSWENTALASSQDIIVASISTKSSKVSAIRVAERLPEVGDKITLAGYPAKGIPLIITANVLQKMDCLYKGPALVESVAPATYGKKVILLQASCKKRFFIAGMSGGPVQNSDGEYIGTISSSVSDELERTDYNTASHIYFGELTEESLAGVNASPTMPINDETIKGRSQKVAIYKIEKSDNLNRSEGESPINTETYNFWIDDYQLTYSLKNGLVDGIVRGVNSKGLRADEYFQDGQWLDIDGDRKMFTAIAK